jgi:sigma-B regulation protein RsbQ
MTPELEKRHRVTVEGEGPATLVFVHGFGCDQTMWRYVRPAFSSRYRTVAYDLLGCGQSDLSAYDFDKYATLHGHASDLVDIIDSCGRGPVFVVGHSVSAMIGVLADRQAPGRIAGHLMLGPSPCYIDEGDYVGGFSRADIDSLLETLEGNYLGWSGSMAPAIMGVPERPDLREELTNAFCRTDPKIAAHFARVTFLSDHRADLVDVDTPVLIVQCSEDLIAPVCVGEYLQRSLRHARLEVVENVGHCPHMSAPEASVAVMDAFLDSVLDGGR